MADIISEMDASNAKDGCQTEISSGKKDLSSGSVIGGAIAMNPAYGIQQGSFSNKLTDQFYYGRCLGQGAFGTLVAIKVSTEKSKNKCLKQECLVLNALPHPDFISCRWFGSCVGLNVLVMDLVGPSLAYLLGLCRGSFTLKTTLMIADQCLTLLEKLHNAGYIHRDLKPENIAIGNGEKCCNQIYLIDFGLAKKFQVTEPTEKRRGLFGTPNYCSVNSHELIELSRRDDLETFGYVLARFLKGHLPWTTNPDSPSKAAICRMKRETSAEILFKEFPPCFTEYMAYCKSLKFEDTPDYEYLRKLFQTEMTRMKFAYDCQFDWILKNLIASASDSNIAYQNVHLHIN